MENKKRIRGEFSSILRNFLRASYTALNHYGGQCKMGRNIREGVVDGFLNVFGTKNAMA
nr:GMC oxidoreductase [Bacillus sp. V5-8f]